MGNLAVLVIVSILLTGEECWGLKIASFNIQTFGHTKVKRPFESDTLADIVKSFDIVFVQEVRDNSPRGRRVLHPFLEKLNNNCTCEECYKHIPSESLGRKGYKERYVFFYRTNAVEAVHKAYQYPDEDDVFEREPFGVKFKSKISEDLEFFLLGVHIKPTKKKEVPHTCNELGALRDAYYAAAHHFRGLSGSILGDFNADCSYVTNCDFEKLPIVSDPNFFWLINSSVDTTIGKKSCAYDRIVVEGGLRDCVIPNRAGAFRFNVNYNLRQNVAKSVSDHYPVEFQLEENCLCLKTMKIHVVTIDDQRAFSQGPHRIEIAATLYKYSYEIGRENPFWSSDNKYSQLELNLVTDFHLFSPRCVRKSDFKQVSVVPESGDDWGIQSIETFGCDVRSCHQLSRDVHVQYWVGRNAGKPLNLTLLPYTPTENSWDIN